MQRPLVPPFSSSPRHDAGLSGCFHRGRNHNSRPASAVAAAAPRGAGASRLPAQGCGGEGRQTGGRRGRAGQGASVAASADRGWWAAGRGVASPVIRGARGRVVSGASTRERRASRSRTTARRRQVEDRVVGWVTSSASGQRRRWGACQQRAERGSGRAVSCQPGGGGSGGRWGGSARSAEGGVGRRVVGGWVAGAGGVEGGGGRVVGEMGV